jgi:hypothetical protein
MRIPRVHGLIRRRLLVNYRIDPGVLAAVLPHPFRPKLHAEFGIAGICLIRLERLRPRPIPFSCGLSSENAAHRIAVRRGAGPGAEEAVFIPRRDSSSWLNHLVGGRLFPGEHQRARFEVRDDGREISLRMASVDGTVSIEVSGTTTAALPETSVFTSLQEASSFFERGSLGYSATRTEGRYEGLILDTKEWSVQPPQVQTVRSSFFEDGRRFPPGSVTFDHALVMRNLRHEWRAAPELYGEPVAL